MNYSHGVNNGSGILLGATPDQVTGSGTRKLGSSVERERQLWIRAEHEYRRNIRSARSGIQHCVSRRGLAATDQPHDEP